MKKKIVVVSGIFYPLTMMHYFVYALQRRPDVELITTGPFTGSWIPWMGGMNIPAKYVHTPTIPLPQAVIQYGHCSSVVVSSQLKKTPDLWIQVDAGFYFADRPHATSVVHVATDPHVLNYSAQRKISDKFFNMQKSYMQAGDIYLPYAYDPIIHKYEKQERIYDGCLIGLAYPSRLDLLQALHRAGKNVFHTTGMVYDEYTLKYNQSKVALNISSLLDLNARTMEAMGIQIPLLTNRIPALQEHFVEGEHYMGFDTVPEAVEKFEYMVAPDNQIEMIAMSQRAYELVKNKHTYDKRIEQIFQEVGLE